MKAALFEFVLLLKTEKRYDIQGTGARYMLISTLCRTYLKSLTKRGIKQCMYSLLYTSLELMKEVRES